MILKKMKSMGAMLAILCAVLLAVSCGRHSGYNGYFFFWRDVDRALIASSDYDGDGRVTREEIETSKLKWVKANGLKLHNGELFRDGMKLNAKEAAELFGI